MSSVYFILLLFGYFVISSGQQVGSYSCRSDASGYRFEFVLSPGGETIKTVYGGPSEHGACSSATPDPADGLFKLDVPVEKLGDTKQTDCGVTEVPPGSRDFILILTTRSLNFGYKASDRRYMLKCHFNGPITVEVQTPQVISLAGSMTDILSNTANQLHSVISLQLMGQQNGNPLTSVSFQQSVYLQVTMENNFHNSQSWMVRDCMATTENTPNDPIGLVGSNGCGDSDTGLLPPGVAFAGNLTFKRSPDFQMFLVPGSTNIMIKCTAVLCIDLTCVPTCTTRRRREATESESGDVIAIIRINDMNNQTQAINLTSPRNSETCTNWPYLVAIAALALVLIVTLGFALLLFTNKSHRNKITNVKAVA